MARKKETLEELRKRIGDDEVFKKQFFGRLVSVIDSVGREYQVNGRSFFNRCCNERMIQASEFNLFEKPNELVKETVGKIFYCEHCGRMYGTYGDPSRIMA